MSSYGSNKFIRMATLVSLMSKDYGDGFSVRELTELMQVDEDTIIRDLKNIQGYSLHYASDDEEYEERDAGEELEDGRLDKCAGLFLEGPRSRNVQLILDNEELTMLSDFLDNELGRKVKKSKSCYIKNAIGSFSDEDIQLRNFLSERMNKGKSVSFSYHNNGKLIRKTVRPMKIVHNVDDNFIYMVDHENNIYRFDRIKDCRTSNEILTPGENVNFSKYDRAWGMEFGAPVHVKVKILDEAGVILRALRELGDKAEGHIEKHDGYVIYEDDILGKEKFYLWIRSYGSSVIVYEPVEIRKRLLDSVRKRLEYYKEKNIKTS